MGPAPTHSSASVAATRAHHVPMSCHVHRLCAHCVIAMHCSLNCSTPPLPQEPPRFITVLVALRQRQRKSVVATNYLRVVSVPPPPLWTRRFETWNNCGSGTQHAVEAQLAMWPRIASALRTGTAPRSRPCSIGAYPTAVTSAETRQTTACRYRVPRPRVILFFFQGTTSDLSDGQRAVLK